jgi:hypothetical protein
MNSYDPSLGYYRGNYLLLKHCCERMCDESIKRVLAPIRCFDDHYKEFGDPYQPTHFLLVYKSTTFSYIDVTILYDTMVKMTCNHKNN